MGGYIRGRNIQLAKGRRIAQSWRTSEFCDADPNSIVTVTLAPTGDGVERTLEHSNAPDGRGSYEEGCREDNCFAPTIACFGQRRRR